MLNFCGHGHAEHHFPVPFCALTFDSRFGRVFMANIIISIYIFNSGDVLIFGSCSPTCAPSLLCQRPIRMVRKNRCHTLRLHNAPSQARVHLRTY